MSRIGQPRKPFNVLAYNQQKFDRETRALANQRFEKMPPSFRAMILRLVITAAIIAMLVLVAHLPTQTRGLMSRPPSLHELLHPSGPVHVAPARQTLSV